MRIQDLLALGAVATLVVAAAAAQDMPGPGFQRAALPYPGHSYTASFASGELLSFDGLEVQRWDAAGQLLASLASLPSPCFASFALLDASESYALLGESSNGQIFRFDLPSGPLTPIATLAFNFDAVQRDPAGWYLSAASCGFDCGNEIWSLDAFSGAAQLEAQLSGPSGPVAIDAHGNLFYATQSAVFPAPPHSTQVWILLAARLAGVPVLHDADALVWGSGFDSGSDLAVDALTGRIYLAESDLGSGSNRIVEAGSSPALSSVIVEGRAGRWISKLELLQDPAPSLFGPYQRSDGGRLLYSSTDFASAFERAEIRPRRPALALAGPGASGAGTLSLELQAGPPQGLALFAAAPSAALAASELAVPLPALLPLLSPLPLGSIVLLPGLHALDSAGVAGLALQHQGDLLGQIAFQAIVFDALLAPQCTSEVALL